MGADEAEVAANPHAMASSIASAGATAGIPAKASTMGAARAEVVANLVAKVSPRAAAMADAAIPAKQARWVYLRQRWLPGTGGSVADAAAVFYAKASMMGVTEAEIVIPPKAKSMSSQAEVAANTPYSH